jgi:hypothetical protein
MFPKREAVLAAVGKALKLPTKNLPQADARRTQSSFLEEDKCGDCLLSQPHEAMEQKKSAPQRRTRFCAMPKTMPSAVLSFESALGFVPDHPRSITETEKIKKPVFSWDDELGATPVAKATCIA